MLFVHGYSVIKLTQAVTICERDYD